MWFSKCSAIGLSAFLSYMDADQVDTGRSCDFLNAVFWLSWAAGQWRVGTTESLPFCWPSYQIWIHTACWWCQATVVHWKQMGDDEILIAQHTEFRKWGMCLWCAALTAVVDGLGVGVHGALCAVLHWVTHNFQIYMQYISHISLLVTRDDGAVSFSLYICILLQSANWFCSKHDLTHM